MSTIYGKGGDVSGTALYGLGGIASGSPIYTTEVEPEAPDTAWSPVTFDGTNDTMLHGGSLTGLVNGISGTLAVRVAPADDGVWKSIVGSGNGNFALAQSSSNSYQLELYNAATTQLVYFLSSSTHLISDGAKTLLLSWDLGVSPVCQFYIDGVSQGFAIPLTAGTIDYVGGSPSWLAFGAPASPASIYDGDVTFLWFDDSYIDLSVSANRDKFLQANIGATGDGITGSDPLVYLTGDASEWNDVGGINLGTGGPFYMSGEVVDA